MIDQCPLAIVTGASRRVGRAIAIDLARSGFDLLLTCRENRNDLDETVRLARQAARSEAFHAEALIVDLADMAALNKWSVTLASLPRVDAIVHNASTYDRSPLGSIDGENALRQYRVNALAPLILTQAVAEPLRRSVLPAGGAVVCIGDIQAIDRPQQDYAAYAMSKAGLMQMIRCLAIEIAPLVRVNGVAPGVIAWPEGTPREQRAAYESRIPLGRSGTPDDAAALVRWLILDAAYITGAIIPLDGGRRLR